MRRFKSSFCRTTRAKMKTVCILVCIVAGASCFYVDESREHKKERIVQGDFAKIEDVPWQANILWYNLVHSCGATIIDKSWVLTGAHCIENKEIISVRTGSGYRTGLGTKHKVEKMIMHPNYNTTTNDNDIALVKLAEPIKFTNEQKSIPIANKTDIPREGQRMLISGFGNIGNNLSPSGILKSAYVPVMNQENCAKAYVRDPITDNMFCAGDGHADACQGDSGGPAVINGKLYGIISSGIKCGSSKYPGIYTRVYKYYDWIVNTTGLTF